MLTVARSAARMALLVAAAVLILLAVLIVCARVGLPVVAGYKPDFEARLSDYLGRPVVIGELNLGWRGFGPQLRAQDVSLVESADRRIGLSELRIDLNLFKSAARGMPVINELTLVGTQLVLERDADGQFELHGAGLSTAPSEPSPEPGVDVLSWLLNARQVGLLETQLTLLDAASGQRLEIDELNVRAENNGNEHQLRVDMSLPDAIGDSLELGLDLTGDTPTLAGMNGDVYLHGTNIRASAWKSLKLWLPANTDFNTSAADVSPEKLSRLDASLEFELWGRWNKGYLNSGRGQLRAASLVDTAKATDDPDRVLLDTLNTDLTLEHQPGRTAWLADVISLSRGEQEASLRNVSIVHERIAPSSTIGQDPARGLMNTVPRWQFGGQGDQLPLDLLARLPAALLASDRQDSRRNWLIAANPSGQVTDWAASVDVSEGKALIDLSARFSDLTMNTAFGVPGVRNVSGLINLQDSQGTFNLSGKEVLFDYPRAFSAPLELAVLDGDLNVDLTDLARVTTRGQVAVQDDGFTSTARMSVRLSPDASPHVDLQGRFDLPDISRAPKYLPTGLLPASVNSWMSQALVSGSASNGEVLFFGHLKDFPYTRGEGVFKVGYDLTDGAIAYLPGWPSATDIQGHVDFDSASLTGRVTEGKLEGMRISRAVAHIDNFFRPELEFSATGSGALNDMIRFGNTGPLKAILEPVLSDASATGNAEMDLDVSVPLSSRAATSTAGKPSAAESSLAVKGSLFLRNNTVRFDRSKLSLDKVVGAVGFNESGIRINNLRGRFLDQPVRLSGRTRGSGRKQRTELTLDGAMDARTVLRHYDIPLDGFVSGPSRWVVTLTAPHDARAVQRNGVTLVAESDLVGTRINLPKPLYKSSAVPTNIRLSSAFRTGQTLSEWHVQHGSKMKAYVRADDDGMQSLSIRLGEGPVNERVTNGIRLDGRTTELAIDGWIGSIADLIDQLPPSETPSKIMPISADLRVDSLIAGIQPVGRAQLRINSDGHYVNAVLDSPLLSGNVRYPRAHWRKERPAVARISYADMKFIDALQTAPDTGEDTALDPRLLPPLNARIGRFVWDELDVKDVSLRTSPTVSGLKIDTLGFAYETTQLIGEGYWRLRDPQAVNTQLSGEHITHLDLTLQSDNIGTGLGELGYADMVAEGQGVVNASFTWPGPAYSPDVAILAGEIDLDVQRGRILKVDPGAGRLVGLFALQTIPRRLSLDFKDLVKDGLDFQRITGRIDVGKGIADARLVQLSGPVGVIDITGETNLVTKQYDQRITVLPRVSAALPIIGAITGGASAGVGALLAGGFLKAIGIDFDRIGLREYRLSGSWEEPQIEPIPFQRPGQ